MALASAPTTPDRKIQPQVRRAFTAPIKPSKREIFPSGGQANEVETLFVGESAKIVSFTASDPFARRLSAPSYSRPSASENPSGNLPWASHTEKIVAAGPLQVYRAISNVAFLKSGSFLHAMLPKSQCWCVDGICKFVIRRRGDDYYRIELPYGSDEAQRHADDLKAVFGKILQFEKTPCPFKRGFTVELPDPPETPVKLVPWRPKHEPIALTPDSNASKPESGSASRARQWSDDEKAAGGEDAVEELPTPCPPTRVTDLRQRSPDTSSTRSPDHEDEAGNLQSRCNGSPLQVVKRAERIQIDRTSTAPSILLSSEKVPTVDPSSSPFLKPESQMRKPSVESFHSVNTTAPPRARTPSPPGSIAGAQSDTVQKENAPSEQSKEASPVSPLWDLSNANGVTPVITRSSFGESDEPATYYDAWEEVKVPSPPGLRLRRTLEKRRTQSPLPSSANLYPPFSPSKSSSGASFSDALVRRTCSILIGPPLHLLALMVKIAVRISRGTLQGSAFGYSDDGGKIPCSWDFSSDGGDDDESEEEDDYGIKLGRTVSGKDVKADVGGSWEID